MSKILCFTIHFLNSDPAFHGQRDGGRPEWPPSPLRLFQALLDSAANRWRNALFEEYAKPAMEWLETQHEPVIVSPPCSVGIPFRISVPNNDLDSTAAFWVRGQEPVKPHRPIDLRTMKTVCPVRIRGDTVHYLYPLPDSGCPYLDVLSTAARSITHLGWGVDMVAGSAVVITDEEAAKLQGERWQPADGASAEGLRIPREGTLADLAVKHTAFMNRVADGGFAPVSPLSAFRVVGYRRATDTAPRRCIAFRLRHPVEDRSAAFDMTRANCVAAMMRHATAQAASQQSRDWVDAYVHGHRHGADDIRPRFSYLPLPSIEHRGQSDCVVGAIRRVIFAELVEAQTSHLLWARQMLPGQFLIDEQTQERRAMLTPVTDDWVLQQYTQSSDTWATVTPVVLPGSDEGKFAKAEKLFIKALAHAGYSAEALAELDFRNVSFWPGCELALRYKRPNYLTENRWSVYHVRLRWRNPVKGPIALGAGRHCGLGIFAAFKHSGGAI